MTTIVAKTADEKTVTANKDNTISIDGMKVAGRLAAKTLHELLSVAFLYRASELPEVVRSLQKVGGVK